jgi:hypothetical protein
MLRPLCLAISGIRQASRELLIATRRFVEFVARPNLARRLCAKRDQSVQKSKKKRESCVLWYHPEVAEAAEC